MRRPTSREGRKDWEEKSLSIIGDFEPCDTSDFGKSFGPGEKVTTCVPYLAGGESAVESARFSPFDGPYELLDGQPLVGKPVSPFWTARAARPGP